MQVTGGCLCGAERYRATEAPLVTRYCWCRVCQYIAAGNATVNACFHTAALVVQGEVRVYESVADSGNAMELRLCPVCGVHLFSQAKARPHLVFVRVGTLDDPDIVQPSRTIWAASAPSWACLDPDIEQFPGQPPPVA